MGKLSTKNIRGRKAQVAELKKKHLILLSQEGIDVPNAKFIPKMAYIPKAGAETVIAFFPSEIQGGEDIYTEFVSNANEPEDPERRLWKWMFNPEFDTEYEKSTPHPATGHIRYFIPVAELIDVANPQASTPQPEPIPEVTTEVIQEVEQKGIDFDALPDPDRDAPVGQMTIRDKAAINWRKPVSEKAWLNELIRETFNT